MIKLTSEAVAQILDRDDAPARELAREFGRSIRRIEQIRQTHGQIAPRFVTAEERRVIAELRGQGMSQPKIAETLGRACSTVRLIIASQRVNQD